MYDTIIIGGGPAGLTAAIYAARSGMKTLLFEGNVFGGELANIKEIENYPGYIGNGYELAITMKKQAEKFGTTFVNDNAENIVEKDGVFTVSSQTEKYQGKTVIIATGVKRKSLPMFDAMYGMGVSYCATCDGFFYGGEDVAVVGEGNTAINDALYLANICKTVYVINQKDEFRTNDGLMEKLAEKTNVKLMTSTVTKGVLGKDAVTGLKLFDLKEMKDDELAVTGVFVALGHSSEKALIKGLEMNDKNEIVTHEKVKTSVKGVFAAGDNTDIEMKQVVTAAAMGAEAAEAARVYLEENK